VPTLEEYFNDPGAIAELILKAIVLLGDYNNWCQGDAAALTADCRRTRPASPEAVAWTIEGALAKFSPHGVLTPKVLWYMDWLVFEKTGREDGVAWFNNMYDHGTIIDFLEEAYRRLP
jgi:hypothetical protein